MANIYNSAESRYPNRTQNELIRQFVLDPDFVYYLLWVFHFIMKSAARYRTYLLLSIIWMLSSTIALSQVEICDNGLDDDGDRLIDLNDPDCYCEVIEPVSLIPNPSFEDQDCCPGDRSELNCATDWIQASEPTTDYIHSCNWLGWDDFPPPMPFPDGDGIMGFRDGRVRQGNPEPYWKEYAGACLINPLEQDSTYRFQFDVGFVDLQRSPPIDISFFGTRSCEYLPFGRGNESFGCPSNDPNWEKLAEVRVSGGNRSQWVNTILDITPRQDIYAIAIGPDCEAVSTPVSLYYFFDNLLLSDLAAFDLQIRESQHPCSEDYTLSVPDNLSFSYQWYKDGVALVGEAFGELTQHYGDGDYQVRIFNGDDCRLSAAFEYRQPVIDAPERRNICVGDSYTFGDRTLSEVGTYIDTFKSVDNCDSIVTLELDLIGARYDTLALTLYQGQSFDIADMTLEGEGDYPLTLVSSLGCDSLLLVDLDYAKVFIPNVFSPGALGDNAVFRPYIAEPLVAQVDIQIFDRWGNQVFRGPEWDGGDLSSGVYMYRMHVTFDVGEPEVFYGDVTLLR